MERFSNDLIFSHSLTNMLELILINQSVKNTSNDVHHFWRLHSPSSASWAKEKAGSLGLPCFDASSIEKLSGDNTHEEKERVLAALATG